MLPDQPARRLAWEACYNARDLGGYRIADGGRTRWRALVRSDNLSRLTPAGQEALIEYGVRTVIDLRREAELAIDLNPFASAPSGARRPRYINLQLGRGADRAGVLAVKAAGEGDSGSLLKLFQQVLDHYWRGIAAIVGAVAAAQDGAVLFHCHAGKDRSGLIAALLLALAGVPQATIVEDYALSQICLQPLFDRRMSQEPDPAKREQLARWLGVVPETMAGVLAHLDARHGGAEAYLRAAGVADADLERLRRRIRE